MPNMFTIQENEDYWLSKAEVLKLIRMTDVFIIGYNPALLNSNMKRNLLAKLIFELGIVPGYFWFGTTAPGR